MSREPEHRENDFWLDRLIGMGRKAFWEEQKLEIAAVVTCSIWVMVSLIAWIYLFTAGIYQKLLVVELIANGLVFALSLFWVCKVGYEDRMKQNLIVTLVITILVTMIAMYIADVEVLRPAQTAQGVAMYYIVQFLLYLLIDTVMAAIPVLINCMVIYVIVRIFGKPIQ